MLIYVEHILSLMHALDEAYHDLLLDYVAPTRSDKCCAILSQEKWTTIPEPCSEMTISINIFGFHALNNAENVELLETIRDMSSALLWHSEKTEELAMYQTFLCRHPSN